MDCSPPGSSVQGILQARILQWVAIRFSKGSSWPRGLTQVSHTEGRSFNIWAIREALKNNYSSYIFLLHTYLKMVIVNKKFLKKPCFPEFSKQYIFTFY